MKQAEPIKMLDRARDTLSAAKRALDDEIRAYPRPVAGCDVQYNHLLSARRRAFEAIAALESDNQIATPRQP